MIASSRLELERPAPKIVDRVDVIGVPMDLGADRRGVDMGPFAVRYARLREGLQALGIPTTLDHGNIPVPVPEAASVADQHAKYLPIILAVCEELAQLVERVVREGGFPIVLGGDHSIAIGTLAGLYRARGRQPGLIWIDAHGDINTPLTSPSGNVHGMPLAISLEEHAVAAERTVLIGLRDVDAGEKRAIREFGVRAYTMTDIDRLGMERVIDEAIAIVGHRSAFHTRLVRHGRDRPERGARRRDAGARRDLVSRSAPRNGGAGGVRCGRLDRDHRDQPDPRRSQSHGVNWRSNSSCRGSARRSFNARLTERSRCNRSKK